MEKIKVLLAAIFVLGIVACMEDKGNYDYKVLNRVTINGVDTLYKVDQMDTLRIPLELSFAQSETEVEYEWKVNYKLVSNDWNLNQPIAADFGRWPASVSVVDKSNGLRTTYDFEVEVSNPYGKGLLILGEKEGGQATLGFQRRDRKNQPFKSDLFEYLNGDWGHLGNGPSQICLNKPELFVLCKEGDKKISGLELKTMKYKHSMNENTILGEYNGDFHPSFMHRELYACAIVSDGELFMYFNDAKMLYRPVEGDYSLADYITTNSALCSSYWIGYDQKKCKFVLFEKGTNMYSFDQISFCQFEECSTDGLRFVAGANQGGPDYSSDVRTQKKQLVMYDSQTSQLKLFVLILEGKVDNMTGEVQPIIGLKEIRSYENIGDEHAVCVLAPNSSYWYISNGSKIYRIHADGGDVELWYSLKQGNIKAMIVDKNEEKLYVGVDSGDYKGDILILDALRKQNVLEQHKNICASPVSLLLLE